MANENTLNSASLQSSETSETSEGQQGNIVQDVSAGIIIGGLDQKVRPDPNSPE